MSNTTFNPQPSTLPVNSSKSYILTPHAPKSEPPTLKPETLTRKPSHLINVAKDGGDLTLDALLIVLFPCHNPLCLA